MTFEQHILWLKFCFGLSSDVKIVSEMAKSSGGYPVFSGAQSWSHFFGPQNKIVKNLDIGEKKGDQHCAPENTGDQPLNLVISDTVQISEHGAKQNS